MSSGEPFPNLVGSVNPGSMTDPAGVVSTEWYTPSTYSTYQEPYLTPMPTTTVESLPWPQYTRASIPDISLQHYAMQQQHYQLPQYQPQFKDPSRPRSSPSTFGPGAEHMAWPTHNGLGIYSTIGQPTPPVTSTFPPSIFQTYASDESYAASTPPEIRQPIPKRPFPTLAPNPEQVAAQKRKREEEEQQQDGVLASATKKRKRTSSVASADLSEDDRYLVQLKEDESLPWKDIASRFQSDRGKTFQVAALQMRYKRLREKFRVWLDEDVEALRKAHEYWEKYKWDIIAQRMLEFGIKERWPSRHCARKYQELEAAAAASMAATSTMGMSLTPSLTHTHYSSPIEGPTHFTFMPMQ